MASLRSSLGTSLQAASAGGMYKTSSLAPTAYKRASQRVVPAVSSTRNNTRPFNLATAGLETGKWMQAHPVGSAALAAGTVLTVIFPGLIVTPLLAVLGFGSAGITSPSVAAAYQAAFGPIAAKGIFATLTSAGAGGCGLVVVYRVTRIGVVVVAAVGASLAAVARRGKGDAL